MVRPFYGVSEMDQGVLRITYWFSVLHPFGSTFAVLSAWLKGKIPLRGA
jgi:hypothetical protein